MAGAGCWLAQAVLLFAIFIAVDSVYQLCVLPKGRAIREGRFQGGLANSVGCINGAVDAALQLDLPVVFPVLKCAAHGLDVIITSFFIDFDDGSQDSFNASTFPQIELPPCCRRDIADRIFNPTQPYTRNSPFSLNGRRTDPGQQLDSYIQQVAQPGTIYQAEAEHAKRLNCTHLISIAQLGVRCDSTFNFSLTRPVFRERYFRHGFKAPSDTAGWLGGSTPPITIAVHHRLGDVSGVSSKNRIWGSKRLRLAWPMAALRMVLMIFKASCLRIALLSDATERHPEIQTLERFFDGQGVVYQRPKLTNATANRHAMAALEAKFSFDAMIHADLLVAAASGFSRLAAVLRNKSVLTFELESHPLAYLDYVTIVPPHDMYWNDELEKHFNTSDEYSAHVFRETDASQEVDAAVASLREKLQAQLSPTVWTTCAQDSTTVANDMNVQSHTSEIEFKEEMNEHHRKKNELLQQVEAALKGHRPDLVKSLKEQLFLDASE